MKNYLMSLAALMLTLSAIALTSCGHTNEPDNLATPNVSTPEPGTHVETLTIAFPDQEQTRVAIDGSNNLTGWELDDEVTLVQNENTYTFTCTDAANGIFTGTLPNGTSVNDCQLALYNAGEISVEDNILIFFSPKTRASQNMKDVVMMVAKNDEGQFAMKICGSILQVTNNTGADITASVKYRWGRRDNVHYYDCNWHNSRTKWFCTFVANDVNHSFTLSCTAPTYVYIPVYTLEEGGDEDFAVGLSEAGDAAHNCSLLPFKTNPANAKLFKKTLETPATWENELTLGKNERNGPTSISIETGVDISSYTEVDGVCQKLNAAGTLWAVMDGLVLRLQTSGYKIKGHEPFVRDHSPWGLFEGYSLVESITGLDKLDMSEVTSFRSLFSCCGYLTEIDIFSFSTSQVTDMSYMFASCRRLTSLTLGPGFSMNGISEKTGMFQNCGSLLEGGNKCVVYGASDISLVSGVISKQELRTALQTGTDWDSNYMEFAN